MKMTVVRKVKKAWTLYRYGRAWVVKHDTVYVPVYQFRSRASALDWIRQNHGHGVYA